MKKLVLGVLMVSVMSTFAQKKHKNGKIYDQHPGIEIVNEFTKAFVAGDEEKLKSLVTEDFKWWQMNSMDPKPLKLKGLVSRSNYLSKNVIGLQIKDRGSAYSDAMEYGKDNLNVYTYQILKGFDKNTGFKFEIPRNSIFFFSKDGKKISGLSVADSQLKWRKSYEAWDTRKNGKIYKDHPMISKARLLYAYLETGDMAAMKDLYAENARISDIMNSEKDSSKSVEEEMESLKEFFKIYEIVNVSESGYPDLLEYEGSKTKTIISWWNVTVKNKKSNAVKEAVHHSQIVVNKKGKIINEQYYFNASQLPK
jgi:ketosteroid isomerase-like protein